MAAQLFRFIVGVWAMSASSIRAKIASGLKKANKAVSDGLNEVYIVKKTSKPTSIIDVTPVVTTESLLKDAIFVEFNKSNTTPSVQVGDRLLIAQSDIEVEIGDFIEIRDTSLTVLSRYVVSELMETSPRGEVLIYKARVSVQ